MLAFSAAALVAASGDTWTTCGGLPTSYNNTACPLDKATCCTQKWEPATKNWACCPFVDAVCCSNGYTCCPKGTKCQDKGSGWGVVSTCVAADETNAKPAVVPQWPYVIGSDDNVGDQVCKTGPPMPYSTTLKNVLIIGDSVSIGYTPYVAKELADVALVQHSPWGGDGGAEETKYGAKCIEYLIRAPGGATLVPDVLMFNWGLHNSLAGNCTPPCDPGQSGPPAEYAPFLREIVARLKQIKTKLVFAITSPDHCNEKVNDIQVQLNTQAAEIMKENNIPTVDLYTAITNSQYAKCYCPHCPAGYEWLANGTISPVIRKML